MSVYDELKGFSDMGESLLDTQLRANLISYFNWSLLNKGNFHNVRIPATGQYGGDKSILQYNADKRYQPGQVWQAFRNNWVWESGLYTQTQPIQVSGVYVDGTFHPLSETGAYAHYVDYTRGRIIFRTPISKTSTVKAEYSYKVINVVDAGEVTFIKELQTGSFRLDSSTFSSPSSGQYALAPDNKIQTPALAIEVTTAMSFKPYQLGGGQYTRTKVIAHIIADNEKQASHMAMVVAMQNSKGILTFDVNKISDANLAPLDQNGSIAPGALTHPQMVAGYEWRKLNIEDMSPPEGQWLNTVYYVPVSFKAEVILNNI